MNTKSAIQLINEALMIKECFGQHLTELNEKYNIANNVFACSASGNAEELNEGFYGEVGTYETLDEALKECNILLQGIRIHEGKFSVGNLYKNLSDAKEDLIIDLSNATVV